MLMLEQDLIRFDESDIEQMIAALPPSWATRVTRKRPFASRLESAVGYTLLKTILTEHYCFEELPALIVDEYGKPHLENCELYFNISHCRTAVACVVDTVPVAVDVQELIERKSEAFYKRLGVPPDTDPRLLTRLWTQKEASAKLDGRGLRLPVEQLPLESHTLETVDYDEFVMTVAHLRV